MRCADLYQRFEGECLGEPEPAGLGNVECLLGILSGLLRLSGAGTDLGTGSDHQRDGRPTGRAGPLIQGEGFTVVG